MDMQKTSEKQTYIGHRYVICLRFMIIIGAICLLYFNREIQSLSDDLYVFLLSTRIFHSVYFETYWATLCYTIIIPVYPWLVSKIPHLDKYKIEQNVKYVPTTLLKILQNAIVYMGPLMLLDTFMVKQYSGVDQAVWTEKREHYIQTTRALPIHPPAIFDIAYHLIGSFIVFDIIFFVVHFTVHKNYYLYKHVHRHHHDHDMVHAHVTNQLTVPERITLILSANFALKVFGSHPLTRTIFVPIFEYILVDNHTGYDMPFGLHRIVPLRLVGGAVKHYQHHMNGKRYYQPIFTYLDKLLDTIQDRKKTT